MYFIYTINEHTDNPIMLIDKHIGSDDTDGPGIDGPTFVRELMALDQMQPKKIDVWINSVGGLVIHGFDIYHAIAGSKTKVDTKCTGIAASIAGVIFQAGRKRTMMDYAQLMYHNPFGESSTVNDPQIIAFKDAILKMIATRSNSDPAGASAMMDRTTWLNAEQALAMGLCTDIEYSNEVNKPRATTDIKAMWKASSLIQNKLINTPLNMKKVYNKLDLVEGTNEEAVLDAIVKIENRATTAETALTETQKEVTAKEQELATLKNKVTELEGTVAEAKTEKEAAESAALKTEATTFIKNAAAVGKIKNEATTVDAWVSKYIADPTGIKEMVDGLPVNKKAPVIEVIKNQAEGVVPVYNFAAQMGTINAKTQVK